MYEEVISTLRLSDHKVTTEISKQNGFRKQVESYFVSKLPDSILNNQNAAIGTKVVRDRFGIPHIFAKTEVDLWFTAGYTQAQDRLWQMDYRRRTAFGTLSEILGKEFLIEDIQNRTIGLGRAATLELNSLDERSSQALEAYAYGVNKWMEIAYDNLPVEFDILDYQPTKWSAKDSLAILRYFWWSLTGRLFETVGAERVLRQTSIEVSKWILKPEASEYIVPTDPSIKHGEPEGGGDDGTGSNNWVVGPKNSLSGMPVLASDPHWPIHFPDLWYEQHLNGPSIDCIGAAYPGAPPIIFGRTRNAAWARTNNATSTRDLYHEKLDPNTPKNYIDKGTSVPFSILRETIKVKNSADHHFEIRLTKRGPIVNQCISTIDDISDTPISLRWIGHEKIGDVKSLIDLNCSKSADDIKAVLSDWRLSVWNAIYADNQGTFGYQMSGNIPLRNRRTRGYRNTISSDDEWNNYVTTDSLPGLHCPAQGWAASANNTPGSVESLHNQTGAYADGYRFRRIAHILSQTDKLTPEQIRSLQSDNLDPRAVDLKDKMSDLLKKVGSEKCVLLARLLNSWNCTFDLDQKGASVWAGLWTRFVNNIGNSLMTKHAAELMADASGAVARALILEDPSLPKSLNIKVDSLIESAAIGTFDHLSRTLGDNIDNWNWGAAHKVTLIHPLASNSLLSELLNLGPFPCPGGGGTVNNRRPIESSDGFINASGVSYRFFVDFSETGKAWGASLAGQSGQPGSKHYSDRVLETLENQYHPLYMDMKDIASVAEFEFRVPTRHSRRENT